MKNPFCHRWYLFFVVRRKIYLAIYNWTLTYQIISSILFIMESVYLKAHQSLLYHTKEVGMKPFNNG